jgi:hypothetical protein
VKVEAERLVAGQKAFGAMSRGVEVLWRPQLPAEFVARVTRSARSDARAPEDGAAPLIASPEAAVGGRISLPRGDGHQTCGFTPSTRRS